MRPGKICLGCEKGMGYSDDGWGYRSYGLRKKRWYQIKSCTTPEKCDIHFLHEVEWVQNNSKLQSSNDVEESGVKPINFTISIEDVGSIIFFILFVLAIFAAPILVLWGLYFMVEIST